MISWIVDWWFDLALSDNIFVSLASMYLLYAFGFVVLAAFCFLYFLLGGH